MSESTYTVTGMTCGHCADSVTREVTGITGVRNVEVDVASGRVRALSDSPLSTEDVRAAVTEAGYELVGS
ncbi:Copper chaperone [Alloactinosynnema sp. L-07]|uniref:heavy-metal-associated domain-containing protein n=1 Tax=Alloactinosynnema sp. L-07 TaxID=1653480 RepID=UPI00065EFD03|nr:heavy-metal-associated domain-containing protein [Alloactinosynnema sp. L-07]CRK55275.1 Copper chaperone [Alloactinosynnema sp. L-07]